MSVIRRERGLSLWSLISSWLGAWFCVSGLWAAVPSTVLTDSSHISGFELSGNGLHWWGGPGECGGEFPFTATVRLRGTIFSSTKTLVSDCHVHGGDVHNAVRDDAYAYFFRDGVLHRKALNAAETDPSSPFPAPGGAAEVTLPGAQGSAYLELAGGYLYWDEFNSGNEITSIQRMPTDGSANPAWFLAVGGGATVRKLKWFTYLDSNDATIEAVAVLMADGRLLRRNMNPAGSAALLATGVSDFAIHRRTAGFPSVTTVYIYAAKGEVNAIVSPSATAGSLLRINTRTGQATTIYTASGKNQVISVTTDSDSFSSPFFNGTPKNVYITEARVEFGGLFWAMTDFYIYRHSLPGTTSDWDWIVATGAGGNLRSDDQYLYFNTGTRIKRIPTDAPPIELELRADDLEVVQNSQDLDNSVRLVANKPTFVRAYAHLTKNTTGKNTWFASATLTGQRDGQNLPGSPLSHVNNASIDTTANLTTLRGSLNTSYLFELPESWTTAGDVLLTFTINSSGGIPETGASPNADNAVATTVHFAKKDRPCLVLVPMRTTAPDYNPSAPDSGLADILARTRSLLPVEDFRVFTINEPIEKPVFYVEVEWLPCPVPPFVCPIPVPKVRMDPFNMQSDDNWALFWLTFAHFFSSDPGGCDDTHWVGTVHRSISGFNGIGGRSDLNLQDLSDDLPDIPIPDVGTSDFLVVRMESGSGTNPWDSPLGGRSLAHELGHNYGRKHIDQSLSSTGCGGSTPDGPYQTYPFDPCTIGPASGTSAIFGFDPITQSILSPTVGGDLMSYSDTRWISKFTWDAIWDKTITLQSKAASFSLASDSDSASPDPNGPMLLVNGFIRPAENVGSIRPSYVLPPGVADAAKIVKSLDALGAMPAENPYKLRLLDGAGHALAQYPLLLAGQADGSKAQLGFVQFVPWSPAVRRLQLVKNETVLGETVVSEHAPGLTLSAPVVNEAEQAIELSWTATDPDGDPLVFTIQYSADNGLKWLTLRLNTPFTTTRLNSSMLPGSTQARLRVIASDGVNTAIGVTPPFTLAQHAPKPIIDGVTENQRVPFGARPRLEGLALDAEEGSLPGAGLQWQVTGPLAFSAQGSGLSLPDLVPGNYAVQLSATDSDGNTGVAVRHFEVLPLPVPEGVGIVLDGACSDSAYANAAFVRIPLGNGAFARARLVHAASRLYVSFTDLPYSVGKDSVGIILDVDAGGHTTPQPGDVGFYVDEDGIPSQAVGDGVSMQPTLSPKLGYSAAIVRGPDSWSAELCIDESLIGGWNHLTRLFLHVDSTARGEEHAWPPLASLGAPLSWGTAYLGQIPAPTNRPPIAIAGADQTVPVPLPTVLYLDGSSSYDPDGDALSYAWTQVSGPSVTLMNSQTSTPQFLVNPVQVATTLGFRLIASDGVTNSVPDEVQIKLQPAPAPLLTLPASKGGDVLANGAFSGCLRGLPERRYGIEATTNLVNWEAIGAAFSDFYGNMSFMDADAQHHPYRFYRAVTP